MSYNQVIVVGNVGRDPELKYTKSGIAVVDVPIAVNEVRTDQDGNRQESTTWWRVTFWRRDAEIIAQYVKKGKLLLVHGTKVEARAYLDRNNEPRASLEMTADRFKFLGGRDDGSEYGGGGGGRNMNAASGDYPQDNDFAAPPGDVDEIPF